jgi:hypothetical protein
LNANNENPDLEPGSVGISIPPSDFPFAAQIIPPVPDEFLPEFGRVAAVWSGYESAFEDILIALLRGTGHSDERWRGQSYEQKANLLRDKLDTVFFAYPWIYTFVASTVEAGARLQRSRNLLLHGRLVVRWGQVPHEPTANVCIVAQGRRKKQQVEQMFTVRDLRNLYAEISYAGARLAMLGIPPHHIFEMFYQMVPPHGSLLDIFFLRDFLRNNYPYLSNRPTPVDPPAPSRA